MPKPSFPAAGEALPAAKPTVFLAVSPSLRLRLATTIENLIALMDEIDGDPDLEPDLDAEVGTWPEELSARTQDRGGDENLEDDADDEDGGDREPWLGSPRLLDENSSQVLWADGGCDRDREDENEHGGNILDEPHDDQWEYGVGEVISTPPAGLAQRATEARP